MVPEMMDLVWAVFGSQMRSEASSDPVTMSFPSGVKAPHVTAPLWPANTFMQAPT